MVRTSSDPPGRPLRLLLAPATGSYAAALSGVRERPGTEVLEFSDLEAASHALEDPSLAVALIDASGGAFEGTLTWLRAMRATLERSQVPLLLLLDQPTEDEVCAAFDTGVTDVVRGPVGPNEILARVERARLVRQSARELAEKQRDAQVMLELTQALASSLDFREILFTVVRRIAEVVQVERVSIVLAPSEDDKVGYVVVASDDEQLSNLKLDLRKYPEIQEVLRTCNVLTIEDATTHPVLDGVRADMQQTAFRTMTLLPIVWEKAAIGVLFLRAKTESRAISQREISFCRIVANATAVALRNARVMQSLRDHTQQETFARFEAERRLQSLKRYADLFASAADGIAVAVPSGALLFANPRAYQITGYTAHTMQGESVLDIIHPDDRDRARETWSRLSDPHFSSNEDLRMMRKDGVGIVCNLSFAPVVDGDGAVLITFRDVTEQRKLEAELVHTKEFLESLIDASVDGIVAADMKGTIILFNKGAERIYGHKAEDVLGIMSVEALYPGSGAREIMAMIRSPKHGGVGRVESLRAFALGKDGSQIPISISASMVYEAGEPVATFGIFTDLRERLRAEENLARAQEQLAVSEKQALIAELAGTAAHELNQPLTSVMGYAELLKRKVAQGGPEQRAADVIVRESERMAEIVRKIGKITKYETKSYVGRQKILDLEKATETEEPAGTGRG